jgi:hypothetical protein
LTAAGCEEDEERRSAEMAEKHLERQAEQNRQMAELHREVAEGTRRLVEADARTREEMVSLQRDVQAESAEVGRQRDMLERERRDLAARRYLDPIIAAAVTHTGLLLACLLPLVICWYLLHRRIEPADDQAVAEVLLEDLVTDRPLLLPPMVSTRAVGSGDYGSAACLPNSAEGVEEST